MASRLCTDPDLVFWNDVLTSWNKTRQAAKAVSWRRLHLLAKFPGITRLLNLKEESLRSDEDEAQLRKSGRAAGRWAFALERVLRANYHQRLKHGDKSQKLMYRQLIALRSVKALLRDGLTRVARTLVRLKALTRYRIITKTRVLICTIDRCGRIFAGSTLLMDSVDTMSRTAVHLCFEKKRL